MSPKGIVYLVGAGPGDPGLITRRGAELLARADVVCFDRLVHPNLLKLAPNARLVDVGKQPGSSSEGQPSINELLVSQAQAGNVVVRLKGGDPFVFGRGGEEAEFLAAHGVPFEVVPGVTSAVAAPAYAGIPLTHREHASWAAIATGHEDPTKESSALDWDALARAPTAVFLMGIERLGHIADKLQSSGRASDTPAAVVAWGTWPQQRVVRSTLEKISGAVDAAGIGPPAVLVVGDVAGLDESLDWFASRPLASKRVFVTRTRAQAGRLSELLREAGAEALEFPAIKIVEPRSYESLDAAFGRLRDYEWVVFTSANTVAAVWDRLRTVGRDARAFAPTRIAAVGPATAEMLRAYGLHADLVPETFTAEALVRALGSPDRVHARVLLPQAANAPADTANGLVSAGWSCDVVAAYTTAVDDGSVEEGKRALADGVDAVLFTSGSTVRSFLELWSRPPEGALVCCIGPRTAETAERFGLTVDAVAEESSVESLVNALISAVGR